NNVKTPVQFRGVVLAVFLGLIIGAGTVIAFFEMGIGTETIAFAGLHDQPQTDPNAASVQKLTLGQGSEIKRSQGMFRHPGVAASFVGLTLPIVLAYLLAAKRNRDRILFLAVFAWGLSALVLTFSRAGLVGLMAGIAVFFAAGGWSGLISRSVLKLAAISLTLAAVLSVPLLLAYLNTRPASFSMRFRLFEAELESYCQHPVLGAGLNNGTAAMQAGKQALRDEGIKMPAEESVDNHYLAVLTEVGPPGFILFFVFFGSVVRIALRTMREAPTEMKLLLVGIVGGLAGLATQNFADDALAGHAISGMLWLFAALIVAIARCVKAEKQSSP
ncbi:MAG: O-antigen ligase family protein, partial [Candidatus Binataceae bacterium]